MTIVRDQQWESKIEEIVKSKAKVSEDKINLEFIKQLLLKVIMGPKEASLMGLEVLGKVLKMTEQEHQQCLKKIK